MQRAWWNAYGDTAHDQTLVVVDEAAPDEIVGIAPLMHRHELEPGDVAARTTLRHQVGPVLRPVSASATAVFFGASYHADYATILAAPADLPAVCHAVATALADEDPSRWDVIDLRRLRAGDPATDALVAAFEWVAPHGGWLVTREQEEVCPVLTLAPGMDFEGYLGTLDKKERHEIRRKIRRAEAVGPVALRKSEAPFADLEAFIDLHQKRWGEDGLFPDTEGGAASRRFFAELFESCAPTGIVELDFLTVGGRRIAAGVILDDGHTVYYYNAGVEPDARELSPEWSWSRPTSNEPSSWVAPASTSCGATSPTNTNGARSTSRSNGCSSCARPEAKGRPGATARARRRARPPRGAVSDGRRRRPRRPRRPRGPRGPRGALSEQDERGPLPGGRVRVVEVMATGTNGGAQEHVFSLASRLNPARYDVRVISLSHGSSVRRLQKAGIEASVIDEPDDRLAVLALAEELGAFEPEIVHNHMFRAEVVGTKAALHLGEKGCRRPAVISTVHSSRVRCARGSRNAPPAHAADGSPDRRLEGDRAEDRR